MKIMKTIKGIKGIKQASLTLLMFVLFSQFIFAEEPSSWAGTEIQKAQEEGLFLGEYSYQKNITRLEFAKLMMELVDSSVEYQVDISISNPFFDTRDASVLQAYRLGFIKGKSERSFDPSAYITREEMCVMLIRVVDYVNEELQMNYGMNLFEGGNSIEKIFDDVNNISDWAYEAVEKAYQLKILNGIGANQIAPKQYASTEQAMIFLLRGFSEIRQVILAFENQEIPFALVENQIVLRVNERDSLLLEAKKYAVAEKKEEIYFVDDLTSFEYGSIAYLPEAGAEEGIPGSLIRIDTTGVSKDETDQFTLYMRYGDENLSLPVTVIVLDINNEAPRPIEGISYQVKEGETLSFFASDLATDGDGDIVRIKSYQRTTKSFGLSTLENSESQSLFQFRADQVSKDEIQGYEVVLSDGYNEITMEIQLTILNMQ